MGPGTSTSSQVSRRRALEAMDARPAGDRVDRAADWPASPRCPGTDRQFDVDGSDRNGRSAGRRRFEPIRMAQALSTWAPADLSPRRGTAPLSPEADGQRAGAGPTAIRVICDDVDRIRRALEFPHGDPARAVKAAIEMARGSDFGSERAASLDAVRSREGGWRLTTTPVGQPPRHGPPRRRSRRPRRLSRPRRLPHPTETPEPTKAPAPTSTPIRPQRQPRPRSRADPDPTPIPTGTPTPRAHSDSGPVSDTGTDAGTERRLRLRHQTDPTPDATPVPLRRTSHTSNPPRTWTLRSGTARRRAPYVVAELRDPIGPSFDAAPVHTYPSPGTS